MTDNPYVEYIVGGTAEDTFVVPFQFWAKSELYVEVGGVAETNFNASGLGDPAGGSITLVTAVTNTTVSILRQTETLRISDFPIAGPFRIEALNDEFNHIYAVLQDLDYTNDNLRVEWNNVLNKPSTFPPSPHTHDDLYVPISGGTFTGDIQINKNNPAIFLADLDGVTPDERLTRIMQDNNRLRFSRVNDAGDTYTTLAILDENGFTVRNGSGTWPTLNATGTIRGASLQIEDGVFIDNDNDAGIYFRNSSDQNEFYIIRDVSDSKLDVRMADDGANDRIIARFDDQGVILSSNYSVITREKGDRRYFSYAGNWVAGTYSPSKVVTHNDATWLCLAETTDEPLVGSSDWVSLGAAGASVSVGDAFPTNPAPQNGDMHYKTAQAVGLYVYYDDGNSTQWVQTNGSIADGPYMGTHDPTATYRITAQSTADDPVATLALAQDNGLRRYAFELDTDGNPDSLFLTYTNSSGSSSNTAMWFDANSASINRNLYVSSDQFPSIRMEHTGSTSGINAWSMFSHPTVNDGTDSLRFEWWNSSLTYGGLGLSVGTTGISVSQDIRMTSPITTAAAANIYIDGNGYFRKFTSLGEYKENVQTIDASAIGALRPVTFNSKHEADDGRKFAGFIAEEVWGAIPEAKTDQGYDSNAIIAHLVKEVQDLRQELEALKNG